jgi:hypothetical protein
VPHRLAVHVAPARAAYGVDRVDLFWVCMFAEYAPPAAHAGRRADGVPWATDADDKVPRMRCWRRCGARVWELIRRFRCAVALRYGGSVGR